MLLLLAACDTHPAPKQQPPPAPPPEPAPAPVIANAAEIIDAGGPADAATPTIAVSPPCQEVGIHIADVVIANTTDPGQRSVIERERDKMVRSTAEACTTQRWSEAAYKCYLATKTPVEIKRCEVRLQPPPAR